MASLSSNPRSRTQHQELPSSEENEFLFLPISIAQIVGRQDGGLKDQYLNVETGCRNYYSCA